MRVSIEASVESTRTGVLARWIRGGVASRGNSEDEALLALSDTALVWCRGLASAGVLEASLGRLGVSWEPEGRDIEVTVTRLQA